MPLSSIGVFIFFVVLILVGGIKILNEYERGVIFTLGKLNTNPRGPGIVYVIPFIERMVKISLRTIVLDIPPQDVITRDNVTIKVSAVLYFKVMDPNKCVVQVEDYLFATSQLAQTTLRSVLGQAELDELLAERDKLNVRLQDILDEHTGPWGIKVSNVEVKHVDLPQEMQRAMAKQAEAERERRAKIINSEGEFQAAQKLADASEIISKTPVAMQLRYLQTLREIASENNSTTIFPIPIDFFKPFMQIMDNYNNMEKNK